MKKYPSIKGLLSFEAAARGLSFINAAKELNVTPGAISRQIKSLEEMLGAELFIRRHKQVELTQMGHDYLADIVVPLQRIGDASARFQELGDNGAISICSYPTFAIRWLIPRWGGFYDRYPSIDLRLTTTLNPVEFERGGYDFTIQVLPEGEQPKGLTVQKLIDIEVFPVCNTELAQRLRKPSDLAEVTLIHCAPRPRDWHRWLEGAGVGGLEPDKSLRFESLNLAFQAAIEGLGVAIGIGALIEDDLARQRLVRPFKSIRRSHRPFHLVYPAFRSSDENLAVFRDWVLGEAGVG